MADFSIKANDTLPAVEATLTVGESFVDLTTAISVNFIMRLTGSATPKIVAAAVIENPPTSGLLRYDWKPGDTDTPGSYQAEWEIHWTGGGKQTVPTTSYHSIDVLADLDGA